MAIAVKHLTSVEALLEVQNGNTVYYNMSDGICGFKKSKKKSKYEITIALDDGSVLTYEGDYHSLLKTLSSSENLFKEIPI